MVPEICNEYPWNVDLSENSLKYLAPTLTFRPGNITFDAESFSLILAFPSLTVFRPHDEFVSSLQIRRPQWSPQNRPFLDGSKPAIRLDSGQ
jgi:hypothetical protein